MTSFFQEREAAPAAADPHQLPSWSYSRAVEEQHPAMGGDPRAARLAAIKAFADRSRL